MSQATVNRLIGMLGRRYRKRRMRLFLNVFRPESKTRILDVGGTVAFWLESGVAARITVLNPAGWADGNGPSNIEFVQGDGTATPYADRRFDIVFSNSAIEHVPKFEAQMRMAREIQRVGTGYWVQTPARSFPFDAHLLMPIIHWLPRPMRRRLAAFTPYALLSGASASQAREVVDEVRLLKEGELRILFPDARILREKAFGFTKSYIAMKCGAPDCRRYDA